LQGFGSRQSAEPVVISLLVVLEHPRPAELSNFVERSEQPGVEHFFSIRSIESLEVGVLIGLAGLDVVDQDTVCLAPADEALAEELRAVVGAKYVRLAALGPELFKDADEAQARQRCVDLDRQCLSIEVVEHVERWGGNAVVKRVDCDILA